MNKQRQEIYSFRSDILLKEDSIEIAKDVLYSVIPHMAEPFFSSHAEGTGWNPEGFRQHLMMHFPLTFAKDFFDDDTLDLLQIEEKTAETIIQAFSQKLSLQKELILEHSPNAEDPTKILQEVIRNLMLRKIDLLWQEHLLSIDHLRADVHLRVVGQKDPLIEFKQEAFHLFNEFSIKVRQSIARDLFRFEMVRSKPDPVKEVFSKLQMHKEKSLFTPEKKEEPKPPSKIQPLKADPKAKRNDHCPCGSNKKYKKCCGQTGNCLK